MAAYTINLKRKCDVEHESGLANQRRLDGANDRDDVPGGLRQTWPRHGDKYSATCFNGSTTPFRMFHY